MFTSHRMSLPKCFLEGKVAVVTGASTGIGRGVARALANNGVNVILAARSAELLAILRQELIEQTGVRALDLPCDVSRLPDLETLVQRGVREFGRIDILVNNAGLDGFGPLEEFSPADIQQVLQVNLVGALQLTRLVLPHMLAQGWGHVINMASLAGKYGPPAGAVYAATKAGLIAFTQSLRTEFRSRRISATAVCPGFTVASGIYERICGDVGREAPWWFGQTTVERVARATVRAIRKDQPEVIVNFPPFRLFYALAALCPRAAEWLLRKTAGRYFRAIGRARRRGAPPRPRSQPRAA